MRQPGVHSRRLVSSLLSPLSPPSGSSSSLPFNRFSRPSFQSSQDIITISVGHFCSNREPTPPTFWLYPRILAINLHKNLRTFEDRFRIQSLSPPNKPSPSQTSVHVLKSHQFVSPTPVSLFLRANPDSPIIVCKSLVMSLRSQARLANQRTNMGKSQIRQCSLRRTCLRMDCKC